ncbi:MAG: class I SAM-dependent methyltransferase [Methanoregula sp.]|nr:class I SAM-dependent methyltransferase [Methanoregula sp.]
MTETTDPFWKTSEDARQYDEFSKTTFARIYPVIANQILERTGITKGICLDVGSGPASLAIAIALLSDLHVTALDSSREMFALADKNIRNRCMEDLVSPVIGDVHAIPAAEASFDLVISRGSYHFWEDLPAAFREICRVLKPEGIAYIGGGYGSARIRDEVLIGRKERGIVDDPDHPKRARFRKFRAGEIEASIETAGISDYRIISDDSGFWMILHK